MQNTTENTQDVLKESIFSNVIGLEIKETDSGDLICKGYIATTHIDSGFPDSKRGLYIRDRIAKETLDLWATEINDSVPRANKVSVNHNRQHHVAGVGLKGTARVDRLPDGEYGLYVETLVDKTREDYAEIKYRVEKGLLDSFSIEFMTRNPEDGEYYEGIKEELVGDSIIRTLGPGAQLEGWTLASQPMNEHAVMMKEIIKFKEEYPMVEETKIESKEEEAPKVEEVIEEQPEVVEEAKEEEVVVEVKESISEEDKKILLEAKELKLKESKENDFTEMKERLFGEFKEELKKETVEVKTQMNKENDNMESKEMREYKEVFAKETSIEKQYAIAGKMADSLNLHFEGKETPASRRSFKNFSTDGTMLEMKGLGMTTNQNSDTDYLQSTAELSDVYDPVIYNTLNEKTTTWSLLAKDDFSAKGNNQVQFVVKYGANATAAAYTGNAIATGYTQRLKLQTKFKKYQVGVEVDGDIIAAARGGPIGDVFSTEVRDSAETLGSVMNQAIFAEVGAETAAGIIGLPFLSDASGNATLYNMTRSSYAFMDGNSGATYINASSADISLKYLRQAKRQSIVNGKSDLGDLIFVCNEVQGDKFRGIYDSIQRTTPTSSRFGFEGRPEFDGIPIFEDKDCKSGSWFLVDLKKGYRAAIWVPPTLEMLGKDADSMKGFIKTYFATYSKHPNSIVEVYGCAT